MNCVRFKAMYMMTLTDVHFHNSLKEELTGVEQLKPLIKEVTCKVGITSLKHCTRNCTCIYATGSCRASINYLAGVAVVYLGGWSGCSNTPIQHMLINIHDYNTLRLYTWDHELENCRKRGRHRRYSPALRTSTWSYSASLLATHASHDAQK